MCFKDNDKNCDRNNETEPVEDEHSYNRPVISLEFKKGNKYDISLNENSTLIEFNFCTSNGLGHKFYIGVNEWSNILLAVSQLFEIDNKRIELEMLLKEFISNSKDSLVFNEE